MRRSGRMTPSQHRALRDLWPKYGIAYAEEPVDFDAVFGRDARRVLEIGFGNGDSLVEQCAARPDLDFIGIDVHEPGVGHCLLNAEAAGISNLRLIRHDAVEVISYQIADASLRRVNIYFPDPWPKKRHHKRRIIQNDFLQLLARKIERAGTLHIATDWQNYAEQIDELVGSQDSFKQCEKRVHGGDDPLDRPTTKFEKRGLGLGHEICDWRLERI